MMRRSTGWGWLLACGLFALVVLPGACARNKVDKQPDIPRITAEEVNARLERGDKITFVDSRSSGSYATAVAKIPGAIRVPPDGAAKYVSKVPTGNPVVVYCT